MANTQKTLKSKTTAEGKKVKAKTVAVTKKKENPFVDYSKSVWVHSLLTDFDVALFVSGKHFRLYEKMGAHLLTVNQTNGTYFAVWAPNAQQVSVIGNFNEWSKQTHQLNKRWDASGIWEGFIPYVTKGEVYKYYIKGFDGTDIEKGDPFALRWEHPPQKASIVWDADYTWKDKYDLKL